MFHYLQYPPLRVLQMSGVFGWILACHARPQKTLMQLPPSSPVPCSVACAHERGFPLTSAAKQKAPLVFSVATGGLFCFVPRLCFVIFALGSETKARSTQGCRSWLSRDSALGCTVRFAPETKEGPSLLSLAWLAASAANLHNF